MAKGHPGFKRVAAGIAARQGISTKRASAELAAGTRRAGAAARKKNPRLNKVKGSKLHGMNY
jgi:hypothetical protein